MFFSDIKTCLFQTIYMDDLKMAISILNCGFNIEARDQYDRTPLMVSMMLQNSEFILLFLSRGANENAIDYRNNGMDYYKNILNIKNK